MLQNTYENHDIATHFYDRAEMAQNLRKYGRVHSALRNNKIAGGRTGGQGVITVTPFQRRTMEAFKSSVQSVRDLPDY